MLCYADLSIRCTGELDFRMLFNGKERRTASADAIHLRRVCWHVHVHTADLLMNFRPEMESGPTRFDTRLQHSNKGHA